MKVNIGMSQDSNAEGGKNEDYYVRGSWCWKGNTG